MGVLNPFLSEAEKIVKFPKKKFYLMLLSDKLEFAGMSTTSVKKSKKQLQMIVDLPDEYMSYHQIYNAKKLGRDIQFNTKNGLYTLFLFNHLWKSDCFSYGDAILVQNRHKQSGENVAFLFHLIVG